MTKIKLNKIFSVLLVFGTVFYYIPKNISMLDWLESGAINSYFYLLAPINIIIIGLAIVSVLSFKNTYNTKHLEIFNVDKSNWSSFNDFMVSNNL